jgi:hypothetical protein
MHSYSIVLLGAWLCFQIIATVRARYNYPLSSTRHWTTKSYLRPLRAGLRSNEYSNTEEHTGSESPPSEGSSDVKYDRGRRALPLPLPVDIIGFLPIPLHVPVLSTSTSTSTSEYPPPDTIAENSGRSQPRKTADFIARAVEIHGDQYDYSLSEYGNGNKDKVVILCTRHDPPVAFKMTPNDHHSGQGCRACGIARTSQKLRGSTADFVARAVAIHGDQYDYSLSEYGKTSDDKVAILCTRHDPPVAFEMSPHAHLSGHGCRACGIARKGQKLRGSSAHFIARAVEIHGDQYDYSLSEYGKRADEKVVILCTRHDPPIQFEQRPAAHLSGRGCRACALEKCIGWRPRGSTEEFIAGAVEKHGDQYDYSLSEYGKTNQDKVVILCTRHDPPVAFEMSPSHHLSGSGCRACGIARTSQKLRGSTADFIARAVAIHDDQYDYSLSEYGKGNNDKVAILCTRHDPPVAFEMRPGDHLSGQGCRTCAIAGRNQKRRGSTADFIARAVAIHGDQYDYSLSEYGQTNQDKVVILCKSHDPPVAFEMRPKDHLSGRGCRACGRKKRF